MGTTHTILSVIHATDQDGTNTIAARSIAVFKLPSGWLPDHGSSASAAGPVLRP